MLTALRVAKQGAAPLARSFSTTVSSAKNFKFDLTTPYESHKIDTPSLKVTATGEELIKYFEDMYMIRKFETAADRLYKSRKIRGFLHLYNGQEAIAVGIEAAITKKDHIITAYRDHGYAFTRGDTPHRILAELLGKRTGCSEGKGGSMHMYSSANRFWGGNGIVGAQCPIGAGIAFASKYRGDKEVCLTLYGDGAANQGQLFEAFNMAALWKLPVIFVCENNKYGMGTSINRAAATPNFFSRGDFVPGLRIDGMDVLSVKNGVKFAADYSRENGPIVLEMVTYRYVGHSMSDPGTTYRTREEIDRIRATSDPIEGARKRLIDNKIETAEEIAVREKRITAIVDEALAQAEADPFPDPAIDLWKDVYAEDTFIRGTDLHSSHYPA